MKNCRKVILLIMITILVMLMGCSKPKEVNPNMEFLIFNNETGMWRITEGATKQLEKLSSDKIDPNGAAAAYIAMFGVKEVKLFEIQHMENKTAMSVSFLDSENRGFLISDASGKITMREIPRMAIDHQYYYEEIKKFSQDDLPMWEEYIGYILDVRNNENFNNQHNKYSISDFSFKNKNDEELVEIHLEEGHIIFLNMSNIHRVTIDYPTENPIKEEFGDSDNQTYHSKDYSRSDLRALPILPEVSNDGSSSISFYYPQLDKKYSILLAKDARDEFKFYLDKYGLYQSYDFSIYDVVEKDDRVVATFYLEFYPVGNWEVAGLVHEYQWRNNEWLLITETFEIYDVAGNIRLATGNRAETKLDIKAVLENTIWVYPVDEFEGATIEFTGAQIHYGFYASERELTDRYRIKEVKGDRIEILVNGSEDMTVRFIDNGEKIQVTYRNDTHEYITEAEWLRIKN